MHGQPQRPGDEGVGCVGSCGPEEGAAPRREVVEGERRRAGEDAVEFFREVLCGFEALATAGGAAEVVRLGVLLAVEALGNLLTNSDAGFQPGLSAQLRELV